MEDPLTLLEQALEVAGEELLLLAEGDVDQAEELAKHRAELADSAWRMRETVDKKQMRQALQRLRDLNEQIVGETRTQRNLVRDELRRIQGERKRFEAYGARTLPPSASDPRFLDRKS
ncbi:MAG: hypothetical protein V3573_12855 [Desulfovibrionaceae bacterium]